MTLALRFVHLTQNMRLPSTRLLGLLAFALSPACGGHLGDITLPPPPPPPPPLIPSPANSGLIAVAAGTTDVRIDYTLTPAPDLFLGPDMLVGYPGNSLDRDLRLVLNSPAIGTGMTPVGLTPALDPGQHGSPSGGEPGVYDPRDKTLLQLEGTSPTISAGIGATEPLVLQFDEPVNAATVTPERVRCIGNGGELPVVVSVLGNAITLTPTAPWGGPFVVEVHAGIAATDGNAFATPLTVPVHLR